MNLSKEEAAAALASIRRSQTALRQAFRAHRGHWHLWLWGVIWILIALIAHFGGPPAIQRYFVLLSVAGALGSTLIGFLQGRQVRLPVDRRFLRVLAAVFLFGLIWPLVLRPVPSNEMIFAYIGLLVAQLYIVAGLWFDVYLLWLGLILAVLLLTGLAFFLPIFWIWVAVFGGGALIGGGCYVRYGWR
ncbi:MAG: hypothetical protein RLZZ129_898 [Verrucomicrobiota bacterium]|jgi:hypothetical protein